MTPAPLAKALLMAWMVTCANHFGLDPEAFQALMVVESRAKGAPEISFRTGRLGRSKYWGPGGLNRECFEEGEEFWYRNAYGNVYWSAKTMRRLVDRYGSWRAALRRYNTEATGAYMRELSRVERKLEGR